jgi:hypothetical protein
MELIKKNKKVIIIGVLFIALILTILVVRNYQYNKCVRINNEELNRCKNGEFGNYDCSVFENAEELCTYYIEGK